MHITSQALCRPRSALQHPVATTRVCPQLVIKIRRLRHQAGQLSTSDMLGDQEDLFADPEMHWLRERCANTKACAHRLRSATSRAHVRKEVLMERQPTERRLEPSASCAPLAAGKASPTDGSSRCVSQDLAPA